MTQRKFELIWKKHCEFNNPTQEETTTKPENNERIFIDEDKFWDI